MRIGRVQQLLARLRETSISTTRLLTFLVSLVSIQTMPIIAATSKT
jgi:hypothetical protein